MVKRKKISSDGRVLKETKKNLQKLTTLLENYGNELSISQAGLSLNDPFIEIDLGGRKFHGRSDSGQIGVYEGNTLIYGTAPRGLNPPTVGVIVSKMKNYRGA